MTDENRATLDLLDKIRQSPSADYIGPMPLSLQVRQRSKIKSSLYKSLQACRFQLPFDLKLLENLTPLDYLSKYCSLSSRRQYQFKRLFDKYQNRNYSFESSYLYSSLIDLHKENLTYEKFSYLCQLIELNNQEYQFTFPTYAGIVALSERILYQNEDNDQLTKDSIEKCDFYSLDRKLDGLMISQTMKQLLNIL